MMDCEFKYDSEGGSFCIVATSIAEGEHASVTDAACKVCLSCDRPKDMNRVTVSLGLTALRKKSTELFLRKYPMVEQHLRQPDTPETIKRYLQSTKDWIISGAKERSDEDVAKLMNICNSCEQYKEGVCKLCGCYVNDGSSWTNKLRRDNEHCPLGKW
jgi:hypothetical protein